MILYWGAAYFGISLLPQMLLFARMWSEFFAATGDNVGSTASAARLAGWMALLQPIQLISLLLTTSVLGAAVTRAVLEPENDRMGYLRFGQQELWIGIVSAIAFVLLCMAITVIALPLAVVGAVMAIGGGNETGMGSLVAFVVLALLAMGVLSWPCARLAFAIPMTFEKRKFMLFESWPMTRGHAAKIVGVVLAASLIVMLVFYAIVAVVVICVFTTGLLPPPGDASWATLLRPDGPALLIFGGLCALSAFPTAACWALSSAPIFDIYRQLKSQQPPAAA